MAGLSIAARQREYDLRVRVLEKAFVANIPNTVDETLAFFAAKDQALVEAVKRYAVDNYERDGFDILVETYTDDDISEVIGGARTVRGAVYNAKRAVSAKAAYRAEVEATAF